MFASYSATHSLRRFLSSSSSPSLLSAGEKLLVDKLTLKFRPSRLRVQDVSGGCGSMYAVEIASSEFKGKTLVQQHMMVNETLKDDIKGMHGIQIKTFAE